MIPDETLKQLLLQKKAISTKTLSIAEKVARDSHITLYEAILEQNLIPSVTFHQILAEYMQVPFVTLSKVVISPEVFHLVPERLARKYKVIAFEKDQNGIKVAMKNPKNTEIIELLSKKAGQKIIAYLATEHDINSAFQVYRADLQKKFNELIHKVVLGQSKEIALDDAPISKIVDMLIDYAYQNRTSDIHIEPQEKDSLVRFRMDGILHDVLMFPKTYHDRIVSRIKVLSKLRTDEHLSAQDGKMRIALYEENLDIRVSILPIADGEKVVLRLLSSHNRGFSLTDLGMNESDLKKVNNAFTKSYGMILSTGPTGSGKSTSIYAILKILNTREKNITTIEDPIEYRIQGVNQIQANVKTGLTFAAGLRSILRQDPNVIFVGEIRDAETAGIAVNAALTGHLVLSTLHTNDAATSLPRLTDMKVESFLVASTVNVIVAQRLLRKICENCRTSISIPEAELLKYLPNEVISKHFTPTENKEFRMYKGLGCKACQNTGYAGRVGIFEVLEVTKTIKKLIVEKADSDVIAQQAKAEGMSTMLDDGLDKVAKGLTSIEEVLRVTKVEQA